MNAHHPDLTGRSPAPNPRVTGSALNHGFDGDDPSWAVVATDVRHRFVTAADHVPEPSDGALRDPASYSFFPHVPESFRETGLTESQVESLVLKYLLNSGLASGREVSDQLGLPFGMVEKLLHSMKLQQLLAIKSDAPLGDFAFELTAFGAERARRFAQHCTYFGAAPVTIEQYAASLSVQTVQSQHLTLQQVRLAFQDLVLSETLLSRLGEAINMGQGMFLHGAAGNGKSSIAERVVRAYGEFIWIPRAIIVGGEIIRLYDPIHHEVLPCADREALNLQQLDRRWVRIRRPTISLGGELELSSFDVHTNPITGISEAPVQLKSNCGTLVIDDFGRHRVRPEELLNRLVVPLERRSDCLQLSSGRTFRVPFDCMVVFASNLNPATLVDEAFLRRIPYVIDITDPTDDEFRDVFRRAAQQLQVAFAPADLDQLLQLYQQDGGQPKRFCHARDLLSTIRNACQFHNRPLNVTSEAIHSAFETMAVLRRPDRE